MEPDAQSLMASVLSSFEIHKPSVASVKNRTMQIYYLQLDYLA